MYILVINAGSSSLKYQLFDIESRTMLAKGLAERIAINGGRIKHTTVKGDVEKEIIVDKQLPDHTVAFEIISRLLTDAENGVISKPEDITAVGHRIVHGGEKFSHTQIITDEVKEDPMINIKEEAKEENPKINVDADSKVIADNVVSDDEFFDDFFEDSDE